MQAIPDAVSEGMKISYPKLFEKVTTLVQQTEKKSENFAEEVAATQAASKA